MELTDFNKRLDKLSQNKPAFTYRLHRGADDDAIAILEKQLGKQLPEKTKKFWAHCNGLATENPALNILPLQDLETGQNGLLHFATFNGNAKVYFDTLALNAADEWSIVNPEQGYLLTMTMASFWSNKIWHWLNHQRMIWKDDSQTKGI